MEISLLKSSDTKDFVDFYKQLASETDYVMFSPREVEERIDQEEEFIKKYDDYKQVFIARENNRIVGYLGIGRSHLSKLTHVAKFTVGVLADHHRQKIATRLIEYAEKWARERGIKRLELTVVCDNEPAVKLFEKTGFKEEGKREKSVKIGEDYVDEFFMTKLI